MRAIDKVREMPVFQAAAAILIGVFGVLGVFGVGDEGVRDEDVRNGGASVVLAGVETLGKGSVSKKTCLLFVSSEERLETRRLDFRNGGATTVVGKDVDDPKGMV